MPRRQRSRPRCAPGCATQRGRAASRSSGSEPLTVIDVGHTPDGVRQALHSLQLLHGARGLDPGARGVARQEHRRHRGAAGAGVRDHRVHGGASQGRGRGGDCGGGTGGESGRRSCRGGGCGGGGAHQHGAGECVRARDLCGGRTVRGGGVCDGGRGVDGRRSCGFFEAAATSLPSPRSPRGEGSAVGGGHEVRSRLNKHARRTCACNAIDSFSLSRGIAPHAPTPPHRKSGWRGEEKASPFNCSRPGCRPSP